MRNILLFIDDVDGAKDLARKALKIAGQYKANLLLYDFEVSRVKEKLLVNHYDDESLFENDGIDMEQLVGQLKLSQKPGGQFIPVIDYLEGNSLNPQLKQIVVGNDIWMMVMDEQQLNRLKTSESGNRVLNMISSINCPLLLMPGQYEPGGFNRIAYVTDLRYCDLGVIKFLKVFDAQLFVTHISAPGLPDMEERYAQEILEEEVSTKVNYWKIFLRNIKSRNVKDAVDKVLDTLEIKMLSLVNKKHQTFERLFDCFPDNPRIYHNLPTLIFPYLNWFNQASFYV